MPHEIGSKWIRRHSEIVFSLPYVETFNSKVVKRFRTWTKNSLRVFQFRDSYVLRYVYMLPTFDVHFAHCHIRVSSVNCVYGYITVTPWEFFQPVLADGFSLEFEKQQVSSSLQDSSQYSERSNNEVVWMVSTRRLIFMSSTPSTNPLVTVPQAPITIGIIVTFMSNSFFNSLARFRYLSFFSLSYNFTLRSAGTAKSTIRRVLFFCWLLLGLVIRPILNDLSVSQTPWWVFASRSPVVRMVKFKFLAQFHVDQLSHPVVSCLILFLC